MIKWHITPCMQKPSQQCHVSIPPSYLHTTWSLNQDGLYQLKKNTLNSHHLLNTFYVKWHVACTDCTVRPAGSFETKTSRTCASTFDITTKEWNISSTHWHEPSDEVRGHLIFLSDLLCRKLRVVQLWGTEDLQHAVQRLDDGDWTVFLCSIDDVDNLEDKRYEAIINLHLGEPHPTFEKRRRDTARHKKRNTCSFMTHCF